MGRGEAWKEMRDRRMIGGKEIEREREKKRRRNRSRIQGKEKARNQKKPETQYKKVDRGLRTHFGRSPVAVTAIPVVPIGRKVTAVMGPFLYFSEAYSSSRRR